MEGTNKIRACRSHFQECETVLEAAPIAAQPFTARAAIQREFIFGNLILI